MGGVKVHFITAFFLLTSPAWTTMRADLGPAFDRYVSTVKQRRADLHAAGQFLLIDGLPELKTQVLAGGTVVRPIRALLPDIDTHIDNGDLHDTVGAIFIPGADIHAVRRVLRNYERYSEIYAPEISEARLVSSEPAKNQIFLRLRKHFIITVVLNMFCTVKESSPDPSHWVEHSKATYIGEAKDSDHPEAGDRSSDEARGFLWRYESFWRLEETPAGVLVEHEMIALSRRIPISLRILLRPIIDHLPQESMIQALTETRDAVQKLPDSLPTGGGK